MRTLTPRLLLVFLALLTVACGKDKNMEDYQREKLQQNLALYQSVAGTFSGVVRSKLDGRVLGAMQIELRADTKVNNSNDGQTSAGSPILVGNVRFLDRNLINMPAPNGFYDPGTGLYHSDILITRTAASGSGGANGGGPSAPGAAPGPSAPPGGGTSGIVMPIQETVTISGQLTQNTLSGEVQHQNYPEYGGRFELVRNGGDLESLLAAARPGGRHGGAPSDDQETTTYTGKTTFTQAGVTKPVHLVLLQQNYGTAEDFLNLVSPIKYVQASLNYSQSLRLLFPRAVYDTRAGWITATTSVTVDGQAQQMTLDCYRQGDKDMNCSHNTSGNGKTAQSDLTLANGRIQDPPDSAQDRQSVTRSYTGRGYFTPNDLRKMKLVVTYPARTRYEDLVELFFPITERYVQASILFSENTSASFINVKWDTVNGLLDGNLEGRGTGSYVAQLQCHDFYFTKTTGPFTCLYWTNRSPTITINFTPPYK